MITLKDFLSYDFVSDVKPLYTIFQPEQIQIRYISILEPPVEQFVREDEIILSTALSVRDSPQELFDFIHDIYLSHAAAVILAFPEDTYGQLDDLIPFFQKINFPILTLPWNHLFSDIVEHTFKELWQQGQNNKEHLEDLQKNLLNCFLANKSLNDAADIIYEYLGNHVLIQDANQITRGSSIHDTKNTVSEKLISKNPVHLDIFSGDKLYGSILFLNKTQVFSFEEQLLEQYIITPLTLWFDREWSIDASNKNQKREFVWKLTYNDFSSSTELLSQAEGFGFSTHCSYISFVGKIISQKDINKAKWQVPSAMPFYLPSISHILQEQIELAALEFQLCVMTTIHKDNIIVFLEKPDKEQDMDFADRYLDLLETYAKRSIKNIAFIWGFDNQPTPISKLSKTYSHAADALQISLQSGILSLRNCYQLSIRQKIINTLIGDHTIVSMAHNALENIIQYDRDKDSALMDTLECYCKTNYNCSETARLMHLHRQSLLYRLEKIESLSRLSLKKHEDLFVMELCILIYQSGKRE